VLQGTLSGANDTMQPNGNYYQAMVAGNTSTLDGPSGTSISLPSGGTTAGTPSPATAAPDERIYAGFPGTTRIVVVLGSGNYAGGSRRRAARRRRRSKSNPAWLHDRVEQARRYDRSARTRGSR
jgi:hypothetical protein